MMGWLLHSVQQRGDWARPQPIQVPPRCTKCNSPHINGEYSNHRIVCYFASCCQISSKSDQLYTAKVWRHMDFFKMATTAAQYYFRIRICWRHCYQKVKIYQQTKFRRHTLIHKITTSFSFRLVRKKLEWLGYRMAKNFWRYLYLFSQNVRTWQTDTQTDTAWRLRPRLHSIAR